MRAWLRDIRSIQVERFFRLARDVDQLRYADLHPKCLLKGIDARGNFWIADRLIFGLVERIEGVELQSPRFAIDAWWIRNVEHGVTLAAEPNPLVLGR